MGELSLSTPQELKVLLGERLKRLRLNHNLDQCSTAERAGISEKALRNLESGRGSTIDTLLRVLKALDYLQGLDILVPEIGVDPLALLHKPKIRRRASVRNPRIAKPPKKN
jgi:transcriptional regulator with XRE-family HTH domain